MLSPEQQEILSRALSHLREREREIITLYYQQEFTMKQIAERMNIDESRVSQLHSAACGTAQGKRNCLAASATGHIKAGKSTLSMAAGATDRKALS